MACTLVLLCWPLLLLRKRVRERAPELPWWLSWFHTLRPLILRLLQIGVCSLAVLIRVVLCVGCYVHNIKGCFVLVWRNVRFFQMTKKLLVLVGPKRSLCSDLLLVSMEHTFRVCPLDWRWDTSECRYFPTCLFTGIVLLTSAVDMPWDTDMYGTRESRVRCVLLLLGPRATQPQLIFYLKFSFKHGNSHCMSSVSLGHLCINSLVS